LYDFNRGIDLRYAVVRTTPSLPTLPARAVPGRSTIVQCKHFAGSTVAALARVSVACIGADDSGIVHLPDAVIGQVRDVEIARLVEANARGVNSPALVAGPPSPVLPGVRGCHPVAVPRARWRLVIPHRSRMGWQRQEGCGPRLSRTEPFPAGTRPAFAQHDGCGLHIVYPDAAQMKQKLVLFPEDSKPGRADARKVRPEHRGKRRWRKSCRAARTPRLACADSASHSCRTSPATCRHCLFRCPQTPGRRSGSP